MLHNMEEVVSIVSIVQSRWAHEKIVPSPSFVMKIVYREKFSFEGV